MKNTIVFIFLLFSISAFAQQNKWDVGVVGGPGVTAVRWTKNKAYEPNPNFSFYAGFSAQYTFNKNFALHTELAFDRKGYAQDATLINQYGQIIGIGKYITQMNYLTLPLLFRASTGGEKAVFFIQAGPYISYLLNQTYKSSQKNGGNPQNQFNVNTTYDRPNMDFGITSGLGIAFPVKDNFTVSCELRGNYGLVNLNTYKGNNTAPKIYNQSLNFLIGISYNIG